MGLRALSVLCAAEVLASRLEENPPPARQGTQGQVRFPRYRHCSNRVRSNGKCKLRSTQSRSVVCRVVRQANGMPGRIARDNSLRSFAGRSPKLALW